MLNTDTLMPEEKSRLEKVLEEASEHILMHHVSLGGSSGEPDSELPLPDGSGTFAKFSVSVHTIYGIFTAAHVARGLKFGRNMGREFIGLSKLQKGDTVACSVTFPFIYHIASVEHFHSSSDESYRPDIAFIALGIDGCWPQHELIENSSFYDLDANQQLGLCDQRMFSAFYRGAAGKRPDGLLNTFAAIGGDEVLRYDEKIGVHYWEIPNTSGESIAGGSGAGFWRFRNEEGTLHKSFEGVVTAESQAFNSIEAIATPYFYDDFLPNLKKFCLENIDWFG